MNPSVWLVRSIWPQWAERQKKAYEHCSGFPGTRFCGSCRFHRERTCNSSSSHWTSFSASFQLTFGQCQIKWLQWRRHTRQDWRRQQLKFQFLCQLSLSWQWGHLLLWVLFSSFRSIQFFPVQPRVLSTYIARAPPPPTHLWSKTKNIQQVQ